MEILKMTKEEIHKICEQHNIGNYKINDDMTIDIRGNVGFNFTGLSKLPLKFRKVTGSFNCSYNNLTTLDGCPNYVSENFFCAYNRLSSLKHCPSFIGKTFGCSYNFLTSLIYCPEYIGGVFYCDNNKLQIRQQITTICNNTRIACSDNLWKF